MPRQQHREGVSTLLPEIHDRCGARGQSHGGHRGQKSPLGIGAAAAKGFASERAKVLRGCAFRTNAQLVVGRLEAVLVLLTFVGLEGELYTQLDISRGIPDGEQ